jgi:NADPH:quinone reductase-like Zn-dependent oxidoreductase
VPTETIPATMLAVRLHGERGPDDLTVERVETPHPASGEALVRVHAAAITRDELGWPLDRLPAIPSYEVSGVVGAVGGEEPGEQGVAIGDEVYSLCAFDRDGAAAEYVTVPIDLLAPKPRTIDHVEAAAIPMGALSAWQGLFVHGGLAAGQRVLILGAAGGVGHVATQLARWRGATVVAVVSAAKREFARRLGADEVVDRTSPFEDSIAPVDLVFDTAGGEALVRSVRVLRPGGRVVSVAEEPRPDVRERAESVFFIVEPDRSQLAEIAGLVDEGRVRAAVDSVFAFDEAPAAFARSMQPDTTGKIVIRIMDERSTREG